MPSVIVGNNPKFHIYVLNTFSALSDCYTKPLLGLIAPLLVFALPFLSLAAVVVKVISTTVESKRFVI